MQTPHVEPPRLSIDDLCATTGFTRRTVRYYLQIGLIDKPLGEKRGSYYLQHHLSQLLRIKQLSEAGRPSLERIRLVLGGAESPVATPTPAIGFSRRQKPLIARTGHHRSSSIRMKHA